MNKREEIARALCEHVFRNNGHAYTDDRVKGYVESGWQMYLRQVDAVLAALHEPDEAMIQAACDATFGPDPMTPAEMHLAGWQAMLTAASAEPAIPRGEGG